jgi:hypothetical protein
VYSYRRPAPRAVFLLQHADLRAYLDLRAIMIDSALGYGYRGFTWVLGNRYRILPGFRRDVIRPLAKPPTILAIVVVAIVAGACGIVGGSGDTQIAGLVPTQSPSLIPTPSPTPTLEPEPTATPVKPEVRDPSLTAT